MGKKAVLGDTGDTKMNKMIPVLEELPILEIHNS